MIDTSSLRKAWALLERHERRNAGIVLAVVSVAALGAALMVGSILPFLTVLADTSSIRSVPQLNWIYETFGFESSYAFLVALGLATLVVIVLSNGLQLARTYVIMRYSRMRIHALSRRLLALYLSQPYEFFLNRHSGDMSTQILSEVEQTVNNFFQPFAEVTAAILTILAIVALLIWVNPAVAIGAFVIFGGAYGILFAVVRGRLGKLGQRRVQANQQRFLTAKEVLGGIKEVKLHGHEDAYLRRFDTASFNTMQTQLISSLIGQLPHYFAQAMAFGGLVLLCLLLLDPAVFESGDSTLQGLLPLIGVIAFAGQRMMPELSRLYMNIAKMKFGMASVNALFDDIAAASTASTFPRSAPPPLGLRSDLRLEGITYRYPNAHRDGLSGISLTIRAGERIGIVGGTGAGKTTVADIILGLLAPSEGRLLADGTEINAANLRNWQQSLAYVPQEIFLVDASVAENIAFGVPEAKIDRARVEVAAKIAQLDGFVQRELPEGYATRIGERGVRLSGGQRQRIGIARALYHGADLIVLDEATSALDNLTERDVMSAIEAIPGSKTILMIAHRLSTVRKCDRIVVLEQGRIAGIGSWEELMEKNESFRELADAA